MKKAIINPQKCRNCIVCQIGIQCRTKAVFREDPGEKPWVDFYKCSGCMRCKSYCSNHSVEEIN